MICKEINDLLPAYLEDILSPEEKKSVESHLTSCSLCSRVLADLKRAENLVKGLEEVEPPPFFEQRIMARVREEAGQKKGILPKIFFPLHIKIPIQISAMLLVAVLAFYVYQKTEPERQRLTPFPIPLKESGKGQLSDESPKGLPAPSAIPPARRAPAGDLLEKDRQQFAAAPFENRGKRDRAADWPAKIPEGQPSAVKPGAPVMEAREKEVASVKPEALEKAQDRTGKQEAGKTLDTLLPEQKQNEKMAGSGAAAAPRKMMKSAPALSRFSAAAVKNQSAIDLRIEVRDTTIAIREIEEHLSQVKAQIIERLSPEGKGFLKAEISAQKVAAFLDRLETVGKVDLDRNTIDLPGGKVIVSIQIVANP